MEKTIKHKLIFSSRIAKQIIREGVFVSNLVDIHENKDGSGRSVFVFVDSEEFSSYLSDKFDIV